VLRPNQCGSEALLSSWQSCPEYDHAILLWLAVSCSNSDRSDLGEPDNAASLRVQIHIVICRSCRKSRHRAHRTE